MEIQVSHAFWDACQALGRKDPERQSTVPERAREVCSAVRPGTWLKSWQVEVVKCLITRLECYEAASPNSWQEQKAVFDAWNACEKRQEVA